MVSVPFLSIGMRLRFRFSSRGGAEVLGVYHFQPADQFYRQLLGLQFFQLLYFQLQLVLLIQVLLQFSGLVSSINWFCNFRFKQLLRFVLFFSLDFFGRVEESIVERSILSITFGPSISGASIFTISGSSGFGGCSSTGTIYRLQVQLPVQFFRVLFLWALQLLLQVRFSFFSSEM